MGCKEKKWKRIETLNEIIGHPNKVYSRLFPLLLICHDELIGQGVKVTSFRTDRNDLTMFWFWVSTVEVVTRFYRRMATIGDLLHFSVMDFRDLVLLFERFLPPYRC